MAGVKGRQLLHEGVPANELSTPGSVDRSQNWFRSGCLCLGNGFSNCEIQLGLSATRTPVSKPTPEKRESTTRRLFENRVPEHLPIKVKIKREKERRFRDLENQNWVRDLELEVKNVGEKPIYFLFFYVVVPDAVIPDAKISGKGQALSIVYGRTELSDLNNEPTADDVPINPGETKVLMIEDAGLKSWDDQIARAMLPARVRGARLIFQNLSFGDGTGFVGTSGVPWSKRGKEPSGGARLSSLNRYGGVRAARERRLTSLV